MDERLQREAEAARVQVRSGSLRGNALLDALRRVPSCDRDVWTDVLLGLGPPPPDVDLPRGAVPYLPCGVEEILGLLEVPLGPQDLLVDLGAGLGKVLMLAHLLTGVRGHGIELQRPLVESAQSLCADLGLTALRFTHADVGDVALDGTVFFLYSPFNGEMLARATQRLEAVAERGKIVVCAVGLELRQIPRLVARERSSVSLTIYDSRS